MKITVTAADIEDGIEGSQMSCALALSAKRAGVEGAMVTNRIIRTWREGVGYVWVGWLPLRAQLFVFAFDNNRWWLRPLRWIVVRPFSFTVDPT